MFDTSTFLLASSFIGAGLAIGFGAIGAALGEGYTAGITTESLSQRPEKASDVVRNMLVGQAIAESAAIFALVVAVILLFGQPSTTATYLSSWAAIGAGLSMGLGAIGSGIGAGLPGGAACAGIVRQPENSGRILTTMLIGAAVCQTPAIFGMVMAFMLIFSDFSSMPVQPGWAALLGAGLATGLSAIGSGFGSGMPARSACDGVARNPENGGKIVTTMLIGSAVCQTPAIFGLVIAFLLLFSDLSAFSVHIGWAVLLGAGLATGLAAIGPGIGNGFVSMEGVTGVARYPETQVNTTRVMLVGMSVSQGSVVFGLIISLMMLFFRIEAEPTLSNALRFLAAGLCMGFGAIGPGMGVGVTAAYGVKWIAKRAEHTAALFRTMLVGMAVAESTAIYSLVIALLLVVVL